MLSSAARQSDQHSNDSIRLPVSITVIPTVSYSSFNIPRDLFVDSFDLQNLPSLMSPNPSPYSLPEDIMEDDDDYIDEYEIFSPGQSQNHSRQHIFHADRSMDHQYQHQLYTHHQQISNEEDKPMTPLQILRPNHPMVLQRTLSMSSLDSLFHQHHPQQQQQQQQQQQMPRQAPLLSHHHQLLHFSTPVQSAAPPHQEQMNFLAQQQQQQQQQRQGLAPAAPFYNLGQAVQQSDSDTDVLGRYLSTLRSQNHPAIENTIPTANQDMDLMMLSSLTLGVPPPSMGDSMATSIDCSAMQSQPSLLSWGLSSNITREPSPSPSLEHFQTSTSAEALSPTAWSTPSSPSPSTVSSPKRRRHRVRPPTVKKPKKVKPTSFACEEPGCDKVFSRAYNLTSHMKTHSADRPFLCGICPLAFARRHDRERHVRLHTGEKPYNCEICGAGFMRNDALNRHQKLCGAAGSVFSAMSTEYFEEHQHQQMLIQQQLQQQQMQQRPQGEEEGPNSWQ